MTEKKGQVPEKVSEQRRLVVEKLVADMESESFEWTKLWAPLFAQRNHASGKVYRGRNQLHLAAMARIRGYEDPRWMTFNQARKAGYSVKKGSKSCIVEKWKTVGFTTDDTDADTGETVQKLVTYPKLMGVWSVFNAEQINGIEPLSGERATWAPDAASEQADLFIESSRCPIEETASNSAYYDTGRDRIVLPKRGAFLSGEAFLRVLLHEMTHSTGPVLGRDIRNGFGSMGYAFEELVAELGSMFTATASGFDVGRLVSADAGKSFYAQHAAYLKSWVTALGNDPDALFRAAGKAADASDYLMGNLGGVAPSKVA